MLDDEKLNEVETACSNLLSDMTGKKIKIKVTKFAGCARRKPSEFLMKYCGFDTDADLEITINGQKVIFEDCPTK